MQSFHNSSLLMDISAMDGENKLVKSPAGNNEVLEVSCNRSTCSQTPEHHDAKEQKLDPTIQKRDSGASIMRSLSSKSDSLKYLPMTNWWKHNLPVFARHRGTSFFCSGHIATYLGNSTFMVVFDDGSIDYRIRREDIIIREVAPLNNDSTQMAAKDPCPEVEKPKDPLKTIHNFVSNRSGSIKYLEVGPSIHQTQQSSRGVSSVAWKDRLLDLEPIVIDFSKHPPREIKLNLYTHDSEHKEIWTDTPSSDELAQNLISAELNMMHPLDNGVRYTEDSTQLSDSDDDSEEEFVTPWQQMTQTLGMAKSRTRPRRSSISSVSQVDRNSTSVKMAANSTPTNPTGFKACLINMFRRARSYGKVIPAMNSTTGDDLLFKSLSELEKALSLLKQGQAPQRDESSHASFPRLLVKQSSSNVGSCGTDRVVFDRPEDGLRVYGSIQSKLCNGNLEIVTEGQNTVHVEVVPASRVELLPSLSELEMQVADLKHRLDVLYTGRKVQVSLYPGKKFTGQGVITMECADNTFHVLMHNRIRLANVPADKLMPIIEKRRRAEIVITDKQFIWCFNKTKAYIGDLVYVKCYNADDNLDCFYSKRRGSIIGGDSSFGAEEKVGILNGVYSNNTAAVDFADGSSGYQIPPQYITKKKRQRPNIDLDVLSLKNAVLMGANPETLDVGYQVKADHPMKGSVESCTVIKRHPSTACDLHFSDGTIAFEVFPSQMLLVSSSNAPSPAISPRSNRSMAASAGSGRSAKHLRLSSEIHYDFAVGKYVLGWSNRFGRYCSAKVYARSHNKPATNIKYGTSMNDISEADDSLPLMYTIVFDYGELRANVLESNLAPLDDGDALHPAEKLTNFSIDTIGFELAPSNFTIGEAVMARMYNSGRYFHGVVEAVHLSDRTCTVQFDSSAKDERVPFTKMFSVDARNLYQSISGKQKNQSDSADSSNKKRRWSERAFRRVSSTLTDGSVTGTRRMRRSSNNGSISSMIVSAAGSLARARQLVHRDEEREPSKWSPRRLSSAFFAKKHVERAPERPDA